MEEQLSGGMPFSKWSIGRVGHACLSLCFEFASHVVGSPSSALQQCKTTTYHTHGKIHSFPPHRT